MTHTVYLQPSYCKDSQHNWLWTNQGASKSPPDETRCLCQQYTWGEWEKIQFVDDETSALPCVHNWSGWPGAYCLKCGINDPGEQAIADEWKGE